MQPRFDATIHAATRLQICAILAAVDEADFAAVRDDLELSDSVLSKHVKVLVDAGYARIRSHKHEGRARKRLALTRSGAAAYAAHVARLRQLID